MKIAIIPARGGSKRIPKKNSKLFSGFPMISWAIKTAQKSNLFDAVVVSTDDEKIAEISEKLGAQIPFIRPKELSDDLTPTVPVIAHGVKFLMDKGWALEYACCIYPCSPFLRSDDLSEAYELIESKQSDFIYPVTEYAHPIQRGMRLLPSGQMEFLYPENELKRTQDLETVYHDCGQFYWGRANAWLEQKKMHTDGLGLVLPNWRFVDIDNENDWIRAEEIFKVREH